MPETDELKLAIALLKQAAEQMERNFEKRIAKLESVISWGTLVVGGAVLTQILRSAGITP